MRSFRADRVEGDVAVGDDDAFDAPDDFRPDDHVEDRAWMFGDDAPVTVEVLVDAGYLDGVLAPSSAATRRSSSNPTAAPSVSVPVVDRAGFRPVVLSFLDHAEVLSPAEVRADVVAYLEHLRRAT